MTYVTRATRYRCEAGIDSLFLEEIPDSGQIERLTMLESGVDRTAAPARFDFCIFGPLSLLRHINQT